MKETIYIVSQCYAPNTAAINRFLAFSKGFGELGVHVNVIFLSFNDKKDKVSFEYENVEFFYYGEKYLKSNKYIRYFMPILDLLRKLKKNDIVILYGITQFLFLFSFLRRIKVYHERTEHPEVVKTSMPFFSNFFHKLYLKRCRHIKGIFTISDSLKKYFVDEIGILANNVHVINMVVDSNRFQEVNLDNNRENYIAYCGDISNKKDGVDLLIKAFYKVCNVINSNIRLYIIGPTLNSFDAKINTDLVDDLSLKDKVVFLGKVNAEEMPKLLSNSKMLVLSRPQSKQAKYGFPTKLGEYLMTANPVVLTDVGDIKYFLKDKESALISKSDDVDDFADKMIWALENYEQAKLIGLKGREVALKNFNYKTEAKKILDIIFAKDSL